MEAEQPKPVYLIGLAVGLEETAEEVRAGKPVDPEYLERVGKSLWSYAGNPGLRADESETVVYVNEDRTVLVSVYSDGTVSVATRTDSSDIWGPPIRVHLE